MRRLAVVVVALLLARHGLRSIVVETREGTDEHPRAHELNARSIEILLSLGIGEDELAAELRRDYKQAKLSDADRAMLDFTVQLTRAAYRMTSEDADRLRAVGEPGRTELVPTAGVEGVEGSDEEHFLPPEQSG